MTFEEVVPSVRSSVWPRLDAYFFENVPHRVAADLLDAKLAEFSNDPRVSEPSLLGNLDDQLPKLLALSRSPFGSFGRRHTFATPAIEGAGRNNRDQFFDGSSQPLSKLHQLLAFIGSRVDLLRQASTKNLVLRLEIFDILCQLTVGGRGNQGQEGMVYLRHGGIFVGI